MKKLLFLLLLFTGLRVCGQVQIYPVRNQIMVKPAQTGRTNSYSGSSVVVSFGTSGILLYAGTGIYNLTPAEFLNRDSTAYGSTVKLAREGWEAALAYKAGSYSSVEDMARTEGYRSGAYLIGTIAATGTLTEYTKLLNGLAGSATYSALTTLPSAPITAGRAWLTLGGTIGTNRETTGSYTTGIPLSTLYPAWASGGISWGVPAGGSDQIEGGAIYSLRAQPVNATVKTITLPIRDTTTRTIGSTLSITLGYHYSMSAIDFTDDDNYTAPFVVEWFGDSKAFGTGAGESITQIAFLSRNYYRELGYDIRLRNNSVSGVTVAQQLYAVQQGRHTYPVKANLIFVDLGTNDFATVPDSVANRTVRLVKGLMKINPTAKIVVLALLPRDDVAGRDALMATISTTTAAAIAAVGNPRLFYCTNTRTAFTATDAAQYIADKLHPSELGNANWWTALKTYLDATPGLRALTTP